MLANPYSDFRTLYISTNVSLTFSCPSYPVNSDNPVLKATLSSLKYLYQCVKLAPSLTYKAFFPSNLDRQKVPLALVVFNEYNVAELQLAGKNAVQIYQYNPIVVEHCKCEE
jgi:hypothetical protein